jgi:hypothetical protein
LLILFSFVHFEIIQVHARLSYIFQHFSLQYILCFCSTLFVAAWGKRSHHSIYKYFRLFHHHNSSIIVYTDLFIHLFFIDGSVDFLARILRVFCVEKLIQPLLTEISYFRSESLVFRPPPLPINRLWLVLMSEFLIKNPCFAHFQSILYNY